MLRFDGGVVTFTRGEPTFYRSSDIAQRGFCNRCGSGLSFAWHGNPAVWVMLGSLDHPEDWPMTDDAAWGPTFHTCVETRLPWYEITDHLEQRTSAAMPGLQAARQRATKAPPDDAVNTGWQPVRKSNFSILHKSHGKMCKCGTSAPEP
jgi:hypothetical protein